MPATTIPRRPPRGGSDAKVPRTPDRIVDVALARFGTRGIDGTSLDDLARELGMTKQAILYWFPSKEALVGAVMERCAAELQRRFIRALAGAPDGFARIETLLRVGFRLAARHPAMVGVMREANRVGPPLSTRFTEAVAPLLQSAAAWLATEMDAGRLRRHDPELLVLMAYSAVTGVASEVEVLRMLGQQPTLASLVRRRNQLIELLRAALVPT